MFIAPSSSLVVALVKESLPLPSHRRYLDYKGEEILPTRPQAARWLFGGKANMLTPLCAGVCGLSGACPSGSRSMPTALLEPPLPGRRIVGLCRPDTMTALHTWAGRAASGELSPWGWFGRVDFLVLYLAPFKEFVLLGEGWVSCYFPLDIGEWPEAHSMLY